MINLSASRRATAGKSSSIFTVDAETFAASYCRKPFVIRHNLVGNPLFSIPALVELSKQLPEEHVKYNAGNIPVNERLYLGPHNGLSVQETIRQIEECGSWMVLKFVEQHPDYLGLLNDCLDEMEEMSEPFGPRTLRRQAFIFVTSPQSITPYHADPEHGFLLQIRGSKTIKMVDESFVTEREYEKYFAEGEYPYFKEKCAEAASAYNLTPGLGAHIPFAVPHWVENGDEVSVSFSITFRTIECERKTIVYSVNNSMRKRGLRPRPYGQSRRLDSMKFYTFRAIRKAKAVLGVSQSQQQKY